MHEHVERMNEKHYSYEQCLHLQPATLKSYVKQLISLAGAEQEKATELNVDCDSCGLCHSTVERIRIVCHIIEILGLNKQFLDNGELTYNFREDTVGKTAQLRFAEIFRRVVFGGWKGDQLVIAPDEHPRS